MELHGLDCSKASPNKHPYQVLTPSLGGSAALSLLNYTAINASLHDAPGVKGTVPRWMLPVNITHAEAYSPAIAMVFDYEYEMVSSSLISNSSPVSVLYRLVQALGLGSKWPYRDLGAEEVSISASVLRGFKIAPNSGAKVNLTFTLGQILSVSNQ